MKAPALLLQLPEPVGVGGGMCCSDWLGLSQACALDTQEGTVLLEPQ